MLKRYMFIYIQRWTLEQYLLIDPTSGPPVNKQVFSNANILPSVAEPEPESEPEPPVPYYFSTVRTRTGTGTAILL